MNSRVAALRVAGTIFGFLALAHVWRLVKGINVLIGSQHISPLASVFGVVVAGGLSLWMWQLSSAER